MSDSDSDWDVDEDEVQADASPVVVTPAAATSASPVAAAAASPTAAAASPSSAPPSVLMALPIQLSLKDHPALAAGIPAGITLLYDSAKNVITLLAYDQHKRYHHDASTRSALCAHLTRAAAHTGASCSCSLCSCAYRPMLLEPLDGTKLLKSTLPFSFTMGDGDSAGPLGSATLLDSQSRKWTTTFASPAECARFAACLAVATLVAKAAAGTPVSALVIKHDLARGAGKSCKEKLFVTLAVRAWIVVLSTDSTRRGLEALTRVTGSTTLTQFNPQLLGGAAAQAAGAVPPSALVIDTTVSDVEVAEDSAASSGTAPLSLGEALSGGKLKSEGGGRMLLLPCSSPLARELLAQHAVPTFAPEAGCLLVHLAPLSVSKKREKKEKKKEKEREKKGASVGAEAEDPAEDDSASDAPVLVSPSAASPASASSPSASAFPAWSSEVSSSVGKTLAALQAVNEQVGALPGLQQKLVKFLVNDLYEGLVEDLGLRPAVEAQGPDPAADGAAAVDATQAAHLAAVQGRIRGLVGAFTEQNSAAERKGTLAAMVSAWKGRLLPAVQPLLASGAEGLLSPARLDALAAEAGSAASAGEVAALKAQLAKASAAHSAATRKAEEAAKAARDALDKQKKAFDELEKKHVSTRASERASACLGGWLGRGRVPARGPCARGWRC